jgi:hypothetical protein
MEPAVEPPWLGLFVQDRIDRLHALASAEACLQGDAAVTETLRTMRANWVWVLAPADAPALRDLCREGRAGLAVQDTAGARVILPAPARPGIFGPDHPDLRQAWRRISSW